MPAKAPADELIAALFLPATVEEKRAASPVAEGVKFRVRRHADGRLTVYALGVGKITLSDSGTVLYARVNEGKRGEGYGRALYEKALSVNGFLRTATHSPDATHVWRGLAARHPHHTLDSKEFHHTTVWV